jgi:hypothetical protein
MNLVILAEYGYEEGEDRMADIYRDVYHSYTTE